jgi:hypothetical protein
MNTLYRAAIVVVFSAVAITAQAQSAKEKCLLAAEAKLAACQQKLPPDVKPIDPKHPTDAERAAMLKYTEASNECNKEGSDAALACK